MISAVILTKNEEKNIVDCLENLKFCDEIVIVDDYSNDRTVEISKRYNAKIFLRKLDDFSKQRNFGLEKANGEWVLFVDADERVNFDLAKEIQKVILEDNRTGFYIRRADTIWGRELKYGEFLGLSFLRLGKKGYGNWTGRVHEEWRINGSVGLLKNPLVHFPHQTIKDFVEEINYYTTLRAEELHEAGTKVNWYTILLYPKFKFLINYLLKLGFLDGIPGFVVAILMSFHSFLVRGKLWFLNKRS